MLQNKLQDDPEPQGPVLPPSSLFLAVKPLKAEADEKSRWCSAGSG